MLILIRMIGFGFVKGRVKDFSGLIIVRFNSLTHQTIFACILWSEKKCGLLRNYIDSGVIIVNHST